MVEGRDGLCEAGNTLARNHLAVACRRAGPGQVRSDRCLSGNRAFPCGGSERFTGLAVMVFALYRAVTPPPNHCRRHSTPQIGYACDVGPPSHPHFLLWLTGRGRRFGRRGRIAPFLRLLRGLVCVSVALGRPLRLRCRRPARPLQRPLGAAMGRARRRLAERSPAQAGPRPGPLTPAAMPPCHLQSGGEGFEPSVRLTTHNGFRDRRIQPLCHPLQVPAYPRQAGSQVVGLV